jgi:large repetitive protein
LTVTDNSGCTSSVTITVTQPTTLSATASSTNVACHGDNNGTVSSTVSGGTSPYTYAWTGGGSSPTVSGLSAGNYTVNVEDNNGCTSSATTTITQPANALSVSATTTANLSCGTTGSATSTTSGGTSPYTYSWSSGGGTKSTATGLAAGTYTISVTDNNGCTNSAITTITQSAGSLSVSATVTANVSCNGGTTGSASSNVSGGTAPYTYSWTGGAGTNPTASGLSAKTYTLNVTDNSGCTGLAVITITQPAILGASATTTANVSCNGVHSGSASSTVSGGTAPYTYSWTGGAGNSSTANGLSAGNYTLTVTDACGASLSATVIITQPNSLDVSANTTAGVSCNGAHTGSTSSTVSGGTSPYTYSWSGGGGNNSTANGLGAGTYTLTVMDACGASLSTTTVITQPASLDVSANTTANVVCYGGSTGSATSAATGGTSPYNYSWSPSGGNNSTANNLSAGTYVLTVTDACGASSTSSVSVSQPATAINVTTSSTNATGTNSNGTATATVSGGNAPYTYLWTPGSETSGTITGLSAGSYCCDVTDANGCSQSTCVTVTSSTGISNITNATSIRIYPDPTNGYFTVAGVTQGQVIELYNYMGQELSNETVSNNTTLHFDITNRANGIYLIRILNTDGSLASEKKMIKTQ